MRQYRVFTAALLLVCFAFFAGCANLPAPKNANGTVNPSVAVAEGSLAYVNAAGFATTYISTCHATPTMIGCSDAKIAQVKGAVVKADAAVKAAIAAVKANPNAGGNTLDGYIADMNIAISLLAALVPNGGHPQ